jgi:bacterioferritin (cytochrome b1)
MEKLAAKNKEKVIDLLTERLCFERQTVKLYEKVLRRVSQATDPSHRRFGDGDYTTYGLSGYRKDTAAGIHDDVHHELDRPGQDPGQDARDRERRVLSEMLPRLKAVCDQEKGHQAWLEQAIRSLGGDTKRRTELAQLTSRELSGIEGVIMKDPEVPHLLHALLAAEHFDTAGWDLLAELAGAAGDLEAKAEFEKRLHEEHEHVAFLRAALRAFSSHEVLQQELQAPT